MLVRADNVVMAKAKALYGKRLTERDYSALLQKESVSEVARYLKGETDYAEDLAEVKEDLVHRGQLEALVRRRSLRIYGKLLRYTGGEPLYMRLFVMRSEIDQILTAIRLLYCGQMGRFVNSLPVHLTRLFSYDLLAVAGVRSFSQLLEVLHQSPYGKVLRPFRLAGAEPVDITLCEAALRSHYYQAALEEIDRGFSGGARRSLRQLILQQMTTYNAMLILRMRTYHEAPAQEITRRLVAVKGERTPSLTRLLEAPDLPSLLAATQRVPALRGMDFTGGPLELSGRLLRAKQRGSRRLFRFSTEPVIVVLCYMALLEIEQDNIVHIIEGIRYQVPAAQLRSLICIQ